MDKKKIEQIRQQYDLIIHSAEDAETEFWYARELMILLGYGRWENFDQAVYRAMDSCKTSGVEVSDHFREVTKMAGKVRIAEKLQGRMKYYEKIIYFSAHERQDRRRNSEGEGAGGQRG